MGLRGLSGSGAGSLAADAAADPAHLAGEVLLDVFAPDKTAGAVLVGALFEAVELLAACAKQSV